MNPSSPSPEPHQCVLDKQLCLSLNRHWHPLGLLTIKKALIAQCSEQNGERPALALDIETAVDENGDDILVSAIPTSFEDWIKLPVRPGDLFVLTKNGAIRAPTVIVSSRFDRIPLKKPRLCSRAIYERDGGVCQYTGEFIGKAGNLDHVVPRDRGGRDSFQNLVWSKRDINSKKSNRLNSEAGLSLIREPKEPKPIPVSATITDAKHPSWQFFLLK